jgi:hypothetical protein
MANPNIVNVTTIYGNTSTLSVSTTAANVVQNPNASGAVYKINSLTIANINTTPSAVSVTVEYNNAGTNTYIARAVTVPANASLTILGKDNPIYLLENTSLQLTAGVNTSLTAICSFEQIS